MVSTEADGVWEVQQVVIRGRGRAGLGWRFLKETRQQSGGEGEEHTCRTAAGLNLGELQGRCGGMARDRAGLSRMQAGREWGKGG